MNSLRERLAAAKAQNQTAQAPMEQPQVSLREQLTQDDPVAPESTGEELTRGRLSALSEGATFGWGDEISSAMAATFADMTDGSEGDKDWSEIYDDIYKHETGRQKDYTDINPGEAFALNVIGGLPTGGLAATKVLGNVAKKGGGPLKKALAGMGVGAGEGAIAGAGSAKEGERIEGAGTGAAFGTALPIVGAAGRGVLNQATKRRNVKNLVDEAGNFIPINQAAPEGSMLQNLYQKVIGPSWGGQQLRDQNRGILNKTVAAAKEAGDAKELYKSGGKKALDKTLRLQTIKGSIPNGVSDELKDAIGKADGQEAMKLLKESWKDGFGFVKDKTFKFNPKELVEDAVADLDSPVDAEFVGRIKSTLSKKIGQGFTPDTTAPKIKYSTKGVGSKKNPNVELDTGDVSGDYLLEARNSLKRRANELGDDGQAALEKAAYRRAASKIDDQIRASLEPGDVKKFNDELTAYGNYQVARGSVGKATQNKQGLWTIEDQLSTVGQRQGRSAEIGEGFLQQEGQNLQKQGQKVLEDLTGKADMAQEAEKELRKIIPNLNPDPWSKAVSTATLGLPLKQAGETAVGGAGWGFGKALSTETGQKALVGQTGLQENIAESLRNYDASDLQRLLNAGQGSFTRAGLSQELGE